MKTRWRSVISLASCLAAVLPGCRTGSAPPLTPENPAAAAAPNAPAPQSAGLQAFVEGEARALPGHAAIHVRVDGGAEAGVNADEATPAASVIKLPIMAALEQAWTDSKLKRNDVDLARMRRMITVSDNTAANFLIKRLTTPRINQWCRENGCPNTRLVRQLGTRRTSPDNTVTASEMTGLILRIARGEAVSAGASKEMRNLLLAQTRRTRIPASLPAGAVCGNKTGTLLGIVNDVAFVEPPEGPRYAVAVLVSGASGDEKTSRAIAAFSRKLYQRLAAKPRAQSRSLRSGPSGIHHPNGCAQGIPIQSSWTQ